MELKVGDLVYTQLGAVLSFAVVSKVNKTTYTVDFLSGGSDTITKVGMTTYGASGWGRKYIPYEGKVDDAVLTQSKQLAYLNEELDAKRSELYAAKCLLKRLLDASKAYSDEEQKVLKDIEDNPEDYTTDSFMSDDPLDCDWDDDDDWDFGPDPEDDDEPCECEPVSSYDETAETDTWHDFKA